jgi:ribosomal protein L37E
MESLSRRMETMNNCHKAQRSALHDHAFLNRRQEVQQQNEDSESRMRALQEEMLLREDLARSQRQSGDKQSIAAKKKKLADHLKKYPLYNGSFQVASESCFTCGIGLKKLRNPSCWKKAAAQGKKQRRKDRLTLLREARANSAKMPEGDNKRRILKAADDFARNMNAAEKAVLSRDAYHYTDAKIKAEGAPTGYLRGSENSEILKRYGISRDMLEPPRSKFRAELYIPDPDVFGADAKPVLVMKGTDLTCPEDVKADVVQANGNTSDYYERAIKLGMKVDKNTGSKFESAGHSLGGGMASAVGIVTGCLTTVFNPAGLHPNTVAPHLKNVTTDASNVSAYVVDGEIVNSGQDTANDLGRRMMLSSAKSPLSLFSPARFAPLVAGVQLSSVPGQVGLRTNLPAQIGSVTPNIVSRHLMDTVITSIEQEKRKDQQMLRQSLPQTRQVSYGKENVG